MKRIILFAAFVILVCGSLRSQTKNIRQVMDLSGSWNFQLDPQETGVSEKWWNADFAEDLLLPGTTDSNKKGNKNTNQLETTHLSRYYTYHGAAWYSKTVEIPKAWDGKHVVLFLERTRPTTVWVDDREVGTCNFISTPHEYDLSSYLTPGLHKITIRVDNGKSIPSQIRYNSHACTESTQTNWNGIIGRLELQAMNPLFIESVRTYPLVKERSVKVKISLSQDANLDGKSICLSASAFNSSEKHRVKVVEYPLKGGNKEYEFIYPLGNKALLWSEFHPALYRLNVEIKDVDEQTVCFGLRDFKAEGSQFTNNGEKIFLRGKHDACVFPLTGYTAMDVEQWRRYFRICKEYGLNHCRFHSWCPPAACFEAADLEGIYLQPELPIWGSFQKDATELMDFLMNDGQHILNQYSHHPSFVLFALGNELGGDIEVMKAFVDRFRSLEPEHLYAFGSNNFLGFRGHIPGEDFMVTCRVGAGEGYASHARASFSFADADEGGYLNNTYPNTEMNFDEALKKSPIPVIGHETGQFQVYPNYDEMKKYTGVLAPWNFEVFRSRLEKAGMLAQADDFFKASGAWTAELYRADIEMNLRTANMAGFQLLDLQDYPGQGSAYVGILDAFMDSKGLITPQKWREFCCEVVPLLTMPKFCWTAGENFKGGVDVANYGTKSLKGKKLKWELTVDGKRLSRGEQRISDGFGLIQMDPVSVALPALTKACKANLSLKIDGTAYQNNYSLWIYPASQSVSSDGITVARELTDEVIAQLHQGAKVLLMPRQEDCKDICVGGLFQTDYWNYRMFKSICDNIPKPASPGTLGILTQPTHALFNDFPTDFHTNWQWYAIIKQSFPLILDRTPSSYRPIVQVIDNVERNHKLGLVFEFNVGGGKLLVCMADLEAVKDCAEGRQFYLSMINYMRSPEFAPASRLSGDELKNLFTVGAKSDEIKSLHNISYD